jgi:hypothetical protein
MYYVKHLRKMKKIQHCNSKFLSEIEPATSRHGKEDNMEIEFVSLLVLIGMATLDTLGYKLPVLYKLLSSS